MWIDPDPRRIGSTERDAPLIGATDAISLDVSIGRLSRRDAMQMQEVAKDAERRRENQITELTLALERMDNGDYGMCECCREWIAFKRLEARPEVRLCRECAGASG